MQVVRPSVYCGPCHAGVYPLDAVLGLTPGRTPRDVPKAAAKVARTVPSDEAHTLCCDLTGLGMGRARMQTRTHQGAAGLTVLDVAPSCEEIERRMAAMAAGKWRRPILVWGSDGTSIPTRPESARGRRPGHERSRAQRARGRASGVTPKGFAFPCWRASASSLCAVGIRGNISEHAARRASTCTQRA